MTFDLQVDGGQPIASTSGDLEIQLALLLARRLDCRLERLQRLAELKSPGLQRCEFSVEDLAHPVGKVERQCLLL